jgi:hypothetical protein
MSSTTGGAAFRRGLLCALLLAGAARTAAAQDPRLTGRLPAQTAERIGRLADSARTLALPVEPLVQKALEGASKGATPERIEAAVAALLGNLVRARDALGPGAGEEVTVAAAQALRLGATVTQLRELQRWQGQRPLAVPLGVLTDLLAAGVPADRAWQSVEEVARRGGADQQFERLRERVAPATVRPSDRSRPEERP